MQRSAGAKIAPPKNRNSIRKDVSQIRRKFHIEHSDYFKIVHFLELVLREIDPIFLLDVVADRELPGRYAETIPAEHCIRVKESVYDAACAGNGWARMILAHEMGHFIYHNAGSVSYACLAPNERLKPEVDVEWQANVFAAELLAPTDQIKNYSVREIQERFGVSKSAAENQLRHARQDAGWQRYSHKKRRPSKKLGR